MAAFVSVSTIITSSFQNDRHCFGWRGRVVLIQESGHGRGFHGRDDINVKIAVIVSFSGFQLARDFAPQLRLLNRFDACTVGLMSTTDSIGKVSTKVRITSRFGEYWG